MSRIFHYFILCMCFQLYLSAIIVGKFEKNSMWERKKMSEKRGELCKWFWQGRAEQNRVISCLAVSRCVILTVRFTVLPICIVVSVTLSGWIQHLFDIILFHPRFAFKMSLISGTNCQIYHLQYFASLRIGEVLFRFYFISNYVSNNFAIKTISS